jgi:hypothetical protein
MTFDPDKYLSEKSGSESGGFNPDKYLSEKVSSPGKPESRPIEAAIDGAGDSLALGWKNNLRAATEPLTFAVLNKITGNDVESDDYITARDKYEKDSERLKAENPGAHMAGQIGGGVMSAIATSPLTIAKGAGALAKIQNAARVGAVMGAAQNTGNVEGEISYDPSKAIKNTAMGAGLGAGFQAIGEAIPAGMNFLGNKFKSGAEDLALNATGATGAQSEKFAKNAGRELLDRGLVKFGDSAENVAQRTGKAVNEAESAIDLALTSLETKGAKASADNVVSELQSQIMELEKDPSQASVVRQLKGIIDDIIETGESNISLNAAESTKRGFNKMAKNWQDPEKGVAGKQAYRAYRDEVERAAEAVDPRSADMFKDAKKTYGLVSPIEEAAKRRAATQNQIQIGGLLDTAAGMYGLSDPDSFTGKAALAMASRRFIAPRLASSGAVALDAISKQLIKMSPRFSALAQNNPIAFANLAETFAAKTNLQKPRQNLDQNGAPSLDRMGNKNDNNSAMMKYLEGNPGAIDGLQNQQLKEQLKNKLQERNVKEKVPLEQAKADFVNNN